jgi:acyl-CoA synthetase (NDP forming)
MYPVSTNASEILGLPAYPSIPSVEDPANLALMAMSAPLTLKAAEERDKKVYSLNLSDNKRMLRLFEKAGYPLKVRAEGNLYHVVMDLKKK